MRVVRTNVGTCLGLAAALAASTAAGVEAQYLSPQSPPAYGSAPLAPNRPTVLRGLAGGPVSLSSVDGSCRGYAQPMPSHILNVPPGTAQVAIGASSDVDTTLMVQTPDGRILCDDDGGPVGMNPLLQFPAVPGQYRVWVGTYSSSRGGPYNLEASAFGGAPPPVQPQGALYGAIEMSAGARPDPMVLQGNFGGPVQASNLDGSCRGWISGPPSHIVNARTPFQNLRFVGSAGSDTTLVVRYPDGRIACDDDSGGAANPLVEGPTGPGQILVWVGSYSSGNSGPYMLGVTTVPGVNYGNLTSPVAPPPVITPPPVVVTPPPSGIPQVTARVDLLPRIPVTLIGPGMSLGTVAVWSPRGGAPVEVGIQRLRNSYSVYAVINGQMQTVAELPPAFVEQSVVTVTQRDGQRVLVRAEQAPSGSDAGQQALMLVQMVNGVPAIAEQWIGAFGAAAPRWAR